MEEWMGGWERGLVKHNPSTVHMDMNWLVDNMEYRYSTAQPDRPNCHLIARMFNT
jgi:hypothetical protein